MSGFVFSEKPIEIESGEGASLYGADGATKKELIEFAQDEELPFIANTKANSDEGLYRLLESHIIEPLTDGGYVRVEKAGRKKEVSIEQRGIDALAAFPLDAETLETVEEEAVYGRDNFPTLPTREMTAPYQQFESAEKE